MTETASLRALALVGGLEPSPAPSSSAHGVTGEHMATATPTATATAGPHLARLLQGSPCSSAG